jgi:hypothetical protein
MGRTAGFAAGAWIVRQSPRKLSDFAGRSAGHRVAGPPFGNETNKAQDGWDDPLVLSLGRFALPG